MAVPRLLLVEGFPGTGKSTTAQWLAHALGRTGRRARWVYEEGWPYEIAFAPDGASFAVTGRTLTWGRLPAAFDRVP